jgi:hypothetical protein
MTDSCSDIFSSTTMTLYTARPYETSGISYQHLRGPTSLDCKLHTRYRKNFRSLDQLRKLQKKNEILLNYSN